VVGPPVATAVRRLLLVLVLALDWSVLVRAGTTTDPGGTRGHGSDEDGQQDEDDNARHPQPDRNRRHERDLYRCRVSGP
jgi:hypothetical protein